MKRLFIIGLLVFIFHSIDAQAANRYIRQGATGSNNGTDWTNAYISLPATLTRGDTYYIADGSYGSYTFDDAASGTSVITIKKATITNHGTDIGWVNSYGDGQATFGEIAFTTNYWEFNGQTRNENDWTEQGAYGFVVTTSNYNNAKLFNINHGSNITIKYVHGYFPAVCYTTECYLTSALYTASDSTNITMERCLLRNFSWFAVFLINYSTGPFSIQYNYIENAYFKELISSQYTSNVTFANNIVKNVAGTGAIVFKDANTWKIYNNVFFSPNSLYIFNDGIITTWTGKGESIYNVKIYGNTFSQMNGEKRIGSDGGTGNEAKNNIFHGFTPSFTRYITTENNSNNTGDIFVDYSNGNYRLSQATATGTTTLSSPFDIDPDGNRRGQDGTWDRGAYEYVAGPITPPTLSITDPASGSTVSDSINVSSNASDVGVAGVQFKLDGANLGSEDTTSPYSISWNTATASNGSHTLTATSRDTSGNIATSPAITVTVSNPFIPPDGNLIAAYTFNEGSGTTLFDSSGNNNNGTLSGAAWTAAGKYAGALDFNGATSYVDIPNSSTVNITGNALTLEAWVNSDVLGTNMIASKPVSSSSHTSPYFSYSLHTYQDGTPRFCITIGGTLSCVSSSQILTSNTWHHVAGVYDGYSLTIYVNGIVRGTFAISGSITGYTTPLRLGANGGFEENFDGRIDDIRIYNRALSASEIQTDMNTPLGAETSAPDYPKRLSVQ